MLSFTGMAGHDARSVMSTLRDVTTGTEVGEGIFRNDLTSQGTAFAKGETQTIGCWEFQSVLMSVYFSILLSSLLWLAVYLEDL
jgi:hypothetical protein